MPKKALRCVPPDIWNKVFKLAIGEGMTKKLREQLGIPQGLNISDAIACKILLGTMEGKPFYLEAYLRETQRRIEMFEQATVDTNRSHVVVVHKGLERAPSLPGDERMDKLKAHGLRDTNAEASFDDEDSLRDAERKPATREIAVRDPNGE